MDKSELSCTGDMIITTMENSMVIFQILKKENYPWFNNFTSWPKSKRSESRVFDRYLYIIWIVPSFTRVRRWKISKCPFRKENIHKMLCTHVHAHVDRKILFSFKKILRLLQYTAHLEELLCKIKYVAKRQIYYTSIFIFNFLHDYI